MQFSIGYDKRRNFPSKILDKKMFDENLSTKTVFPEINLQQKIDQHFLHKLITFLNYKYSVYDRIL